MNDSWSIGDGLRAGFVFVGVAWRRAGLFMAPGIAVWTMALSAGRAPFWGLAGALALLIASAGLYRLAIDVQQSVMACAIRLAVVWLLKCTFLAVLGSLLFVVLLASSYAVASAGAGFVGSEVRTWAPAIDSRGKIVLAIVGATEFAGLGWAMTRIVLASAATTSLARIQVLSAWPLTRRLGWRLFSARLLIGLPVLALVVLAWRAPGIGMTSAGAWLAWMMDILAASVLVGLWLPLNIGIMSYIYQRRTADRPEANESYESPFAPRRRD